MMENKDDSSKKYYLPMAESSQGSSREYNIVLPVDKNLMKNKENITLLSPVSLLAPDEEGKENKSNNSEMLTLRFFTPNANTSNALNMQYCCCVCGDKFCFENMYHEHMNLHNDVKPYKCAVCRSAFSTSLQCSEHELFHSHASMLKRCKVCNQYFKRIAEHVRKMHFCEHCKLQVKNVKRHMHIHHTVRCDRCNYVCSSKQKLELHKAVHVDASYKCHLCGVSYFSPMALKTHQRAHCSGSK